MKSVFSIVVLLPLLLFSQDRTLTFDVPVNETLISVILDSAGTDYQHHSNESDYKCPRPIIGFELWYSKLDNAIKSNSNINTDSLDTYLDFLVDSLGQLRLNQTSSSDTLFEAFILKTINDFGPWSSSKNCNGVFLRIISKRLMAYIIVDEPARFPGDIKAFYKYLSKKLKYPKNSQKQGIEGRVFVEFIVEKDGSISNARIIKGINRECNKEALRVIRNMPNWISGKQDGVPVRQKLIQNILFKFK